MAAQAGKDILLKISDGAPTPVFTTVAGLRARTISLNAQTIDATAKMASNQVRRLIVLNDAGALTGILSLGDVAKDYGAKQVGKTLEEISAEPADAAAQ